MTKSDVRISYKISLILCEMIGCWPRTNPSWSYILRGCILTVFLPVFISGASLLCLNENLFMDMHILYTSIVRFTTVIKCIYLHYKRKEFESLIESTQHVLFKNYSDRDEVFILSAIRNVNVAIHFMYGFISMFILFNNLPLIFRPEYDYVLSQPFPVDMDNLSLHIYVILYILQLCVHFISLISTVGIDNIPFTMMATASAQIRILKKRLLDLIPVCKEEQSYDEDIIVDDLYDCVLLHQFIIKFIDDIEKLFSGIFLLQIATSVAVMCCIGFDAMLSIQHMDLLTCIFVWIGLSIEIVVLCVFGNDLLVQSDEISMACYMSRWRTSKPHVQRLLLTIMINSQKPLVLTAGRFCILSYSTLILIIKLSYSYFTVLKTIFLK